MAAKHSVTQTLPRTMGGVRALGGKKVGDCHSYGELPEDVREMRVSSVRIPGAGRRWTLFRSVYSVMLVDGMGIEYLGHTVAEALTNARASHHRCAAGMAATANLRAEHATTCARRALSAAMSEAKSEECESCASLDVECFCGAEEVAVAAARAALVAADKAWAAAAAAERAAEEQAEVSKVLYDEARREALNHVDATDESDESGAAGEN
jgi:hypothetical protein